MRNMARKNESFARKIRRHQLLCRVLLLIYLAVLVYCLFFAGWFGHGPGRIKRVNLEPFREIRRFFDHKAKIGVKSVILNIVGNVVGFVPMGILLPVSFRLFRRPFFGLMSGLLFSATAEYLQYYFSSGNADIDDVILNTVGCALGFLFFSIVHAFSKNRMKREKANKEIKGNGPDGTEEESNYARQALRA